eukprot:5530802-Prymnesium_polylepis.1
MRARGGARTEGRLRAARRSEGCRGRLGGHRGCMACSVGGACTDAGRHRIVLRLSDVRGGACLC